MARFELDVNVNFPDGMGWSPILHSIDRKLDLIIKKGNIMAGELDALKLAVSRNTDVQKSALELILGLKAKLDSAIANGDVSALTELSASINADADALAAAVLANTPAAP